MGEINVCNSAGRDAVVNTESAHSQLKVRWLDAQNRQAVNVRILKSTIDRDIDAVMPNEMSGVIAEDLLLNLGIPDLRFTSTIRTGCSRSPAASAH